MKKCRKEEKDTKVLDTHLLNFKEKVLRRKCKGLVVTALLNKHASSIFLPAFIMSAEDLFLNDFVLNLNVYMKICSMHMKTVVVPTKAKECVSRKLECSSWLRTETYGA